MQSLKAPDAGGPAGGVVESPIVVVPDGVDDTLEAVVTGALDGLDEHAGIITATVTVSPAIHNALGIRVFTHRSFQKSVGKLDW